MRQRNIISGLVLSAIAFTPMTASAGDAFVGGLVGGIIGSAIANQPKQRKVYRKKTYRKKTRSTVNTAARQANRETQTALNYFGFNAGSPDGVLGARSRAAVSGYQATLGYPVTGQLSSFERDFLMSSYYRAQGGGATIQEMIASNPQGVKGLLVMFRDEQRGGSTGGGMLAGQYGLPREVAAAVNEIAKSSDPTAQQLVQRSGFIQLADINGDGRTDYIIDTSVTGSAFWCNAQSCAVRVFASTPSGYARNDFQAFNVTPAMFTCQAGTCSKTGTAGAPMMAAAPQTNQTMPQVQMAGAAASATAGGMAAPVASAQPMVKGEGAARVRAAIPNFIGGGSVAPSLQSHCNKVSLVSTTNGGYLTEASMGNDASRALSEQLCLTRTYAIAAGEEMMAKVPGATPAQISEQCAGFGTLLREHVAALSLQSREEVLKGMGSFILNSGMAPDQLETTARICLAAGYKADDMDTAIGSALLMVALGKAPYAEIAGHHLAQGFGTSERKDLAVSWYDQALGALESGSTPVFAPGQEGRVGLLRKASLMLSGPQAAAPGPVVTKAAGMVPVFSAGN